MSTSGRYNRPVVGDARYHPLDRFSTVDYSAKNRTPNQTDAISERPPRDDSNAAMFERNHPTAVEQSSFENGSRRCRIFCHLRHLRATFERQRPQRARQARDKTLAAHPPPPPSPRIRSMPLTLKNAFSCSSS